MQIQYISDLHLEYLNTKQISRLINTLKADGILNSILVILGDITPNKRIRAEFLNNIAKLEIWTRILVVLGNHDFWNHKTSNLDYTLDNRVMILQKDKVDLPNITILGCTLWTNITDEDSYYLNDYDRILDWTPDLCRSTHQDHVNWITEEIQKANKPIIILTHHAPLFKVLEKHELQSAYATDLEYLLPKVKYWFYGHTHIKMNITINGCMLVNNPKGYPSEHFQTKLETIYFQDNNVPQSLHK
jgi:predicted phosphohydrolase